jgi:hypothetical protein
MKIYAYAFHENYPYYNDSAYSIPSLWSGIGPRVPEKKSIYNVDNKVGIPRPIQYHPSFVGLVLGLGASCSALKRGGAPIATLIRVFPIVRSLVLDRSLVGPVLVFPP